MQQLETPNGVLPQRMTVAVIESDDSVRKSLSDCLSSAGHSVSAFSSGLDYLDATARSDDRSHCVILDLHMPSINGLELYGILKTRDSNTPVIFTTTFPQHAMATKARSLEPMGVFVKPVDTEALLDWLEDAGTLSWLRHKFTD